MDTLTEESTMAKFGELNYHRMVLVAQLQEIEKQMNEMLPEIQKLKE